MKNNAIISSDLLKELQTTYKHFPKRTNTLKNETQFDSGLKELTTSYGHDFSLKPGEILFRQGDSADGLYWIKEGILVKDALHVSVSVTKNPNHYKQVSQTSRDYISHWNLQLSPTRLNKNTYIKWNKVHLI